MFCSTTSTFSDCASLTTVSRVSPARIEAATGGVYSLPSRTRNRFSPAPSLTKPEAFSAIPSWKPRRRASSVTRMLDR